MGHLYLPTPKERTRTIENLLKIKAEGYDKRNQINDPYPLQQSIYLQLLKVFLATAEKPTARTSKIAENNRFKNTMNMYFHFSVILMVLLFLQRESVFCEKERKPSGSMPFQFQSSLMNYGSYVFMKTFQTRRKGQEQMAHSKWMNLWSISKKPWIWLLWKIGSSWWRRPW